MRVWTGGGAGAFWHHMLDLDPDKLEGLRRHQIMALARYGRQAIGSWDDRLTTELTAWYRELAALLKDESAVQKIGENKD